MKRKIFLMPGYYLFLAVVIFLSSSAVAEEEKVFIIPMEMMILPGTEEFFARALEVAAESGGRAVVVELNTPGGMVDVTQHMVQKIFASKVPVIFYVSPSGGTATSAGVLLTVAAHVAAMAPGTSIGAAHPVAGDGKDIEGDMRKKAESMVTAFVQTLAEQRGRNVDWVKKSVSESLSVTATEALKLNVVDIVAGDETELLRLAAGRAVKINNEPKVLGDYSSLPRVILEPNYRERLLNFFSNPNIAALLWVGATTGLALELYNPGAVLPGVVGIICLIIALAVAQIVPVSYSAVGLIACGALLLGLELFLPSGVLAIGGIVSMVIGSVYLFDQGSLTGVAVTTQVLTPIIATIGVMVFALIRAVSVVVLDGDTKGASGLIGLNGKSVERISSVGGRVSINGENWRAVSVNGEIDAGEFVSVRKVLDGLILEVERKKGI